MPNGDEGYINRMVDLYKEVDDVSEAGNNSVVRRIKSLLIQEIREQSGEDRIDEEVFRELGIEGDLYFRDCDPRDPFDGSRRAHMSFEEVHNEIRADDRRRSIFLDPQEAAANSYIDFFSNRLDSLELRTEGTNVDLDLARQTALQTMRGSHPLVSVNVGLATSLEEVVLALRTMADDIEADIEPRKIISGFECMGPDASEVEEEPRVGALLQTGCNTSSVSLGTRWRDNGRRLERGSQVVETCCRRGDACCGNVVCETRIVSESWGTVWQDGDTSSPPPTPQPGFQRRPWEHQIPLIDSGLTVDQTSDWGWRNNGGNDFHGGIDIAAPVGTQVFNATDGVIVGIIRNAQNPHNQGVVVRSGATTHTYWHIVPSDSLVQDAPFAAGGVLGEVAPGNAVHLHYGTHQPPGGDYTQRSDANSVDPLP